VTYPAKPNSGTSSIACVRIAKTLILLNGMEHDADDYSDRDASGEDDTDYIDANLAEKSDRVALDPALSQSDTNPYDVGYPAVPTQEYGYADEVGGQVINQKRVRYLSLSSNLPI
jgi:hypothetical protein